MTIESYLLALFLTMVIELSVAYFLGYRNKKAIITVVCVNLISHPLFCYFLWINLTLDIITINYFSMISLEIIITLLESILLYYALKQKFLLMLNLSFAMNFTSFVIGLIIYGTTL